MDAPSQSEPLLRADELAHLLRCGKSTIYQLAKRGRIPCIGIGAIGVRFDRTAVLAALQQPRPDRPPRKRKQPQCEARR